MKGYEFTRHAEKVMAERELDPALERRFVRIQEFGSRVLRVIINVEAVPPRVVTAYFDRAMKGRP